MSHHTAPGIWQIRTLSVVLLTAVLVGMSVPAVIEERASRRSEETNSGMRAISTAFQRFHADTGYWPPRYQIESNWRTTLRNFSCLYQDTDSLAGWNGPYLASGADLDGLRVAAFETNSGWQGLVDGWERPYRVIYGGGGDSLGTEGIALLSSGPNRKFETSDRNALSGRPIKDDLVQIVMSRVGPRELAGSTGS